MTTGVRFPAELEVPEAWETWWFRLEPLGPEHNERDYEAWTSSIDHIRKTPGFAPGDWGDDAWPYDMPLASNLVDLERHAAEFRDKISFAYSVIAANSSDVLGCVYINADETGAADAKVRCWLRSTSASDDVMFAAAIKGWLNKEWPFEKVRFPGRPRLNIG
ncbi:MAG: hypothetical protein R2705_02185 [Ilumatobacteraceae bacterium]